ncbi:hypothetical protein AMATHDRAFT_57831 [Amanita thiersii Skay4041]|uniref:Mediator of RNA polymerase II transcription subunit 12 n=1 Tax=Amanita thiersii Skay4041 TaxID=703135 RepID=A0A2A9NUS1_9AGAR|nr:hypothetical protein AMATHDRAFT_57831 [Amanita thiersii Skay4041]
MTDQVQDESSPPLIYDSRPAAWLQKIHSTADLGYAGYFPARPGQEEDILSVKTVKYGFTTESRVSAESFSAKAMINEAFHSDEAFIKLDELMNELFTRRAERLPSVPASAFRLPTRVTLNEARRQTWFRDLANPDVPLHKLGKSVPHGAKGHDLLDLLHTNNVAISRAVWFLRVFGANETAGLRTKPAYNPTQYSIDWATVVTSYMKKQLSDIALPSAPRPGLNIKQTFKGVLSDPDSRERWISRFGYCLQLLRHFYSEGMVDKRTFLVWLAQQMAICNLAQAGFLTRIADEYLVDIFESRALAHSFLDACLAKLSEIRSSGTAQINLVNTEAVLQSLVQRMCLSIPDAFVSPRLWTTYSVVLNEAINAAIMNSSNSQHVEQSRSIVQRNVMEHFSTVKHRNEAMLLFDLPVQVPDRLGSAVSDIKLLNSISEKTDLNTISFLQCLTEDMAHFAAKIDIVFTWSISSHQYGDHRPFAAVTLIKLWREKFCERASRRDLLSPDHSLQDILFDWLDTCEAAGEKHNTKSVVMLYSLLIDHGLFHFPAYIQRLIARGESGLSFTEDNESRHRAFVRCLPLLDSDPSLISQRKVLLYGVRAREIPEETNERQIRKEIRGVLPCLFGGQSLIEPITHTELQSRCDSMVIACRYEQVRIIRQWLLPCLLRFISNQNDHSAMLQVLPISIELMAFAKCFDSILEFMLEILRNAISVEVIPAVLDNLRRYSDIWQCMGVMEHIVSELDNAHQLLKARGQQSRLPLDLLEMDGGRYLSPVSHDRISSDIAHFTSALRPVTNHSEPVPGVLPEIHRLGTQSNPDGPSLLANSLWIKYRTSPDWGWKVWDNSITALQKIATSEHVPEDMDAQALRYAVFLWHVDQHLPTGLDNQVLQWFGDDGQAQLSNFSTEAWNILAGVLYHLILRRALRITTILKGLIFPALQQGASVQDVQLFPEDSTVKSIRAAITICWTLLVQDNSTEHMTFSEIHAIQCMESRRKMVYSEPFFSSLIQNIPILILLENNACIPGDLRVQAKQLRFKLCQSQPFRQGAYRNLNATREAFEQLSQANGDGLGRTIVAGLRMALCDTTQDEELEHWLSSSCHYLSPWKLAASSIILQLTLKQLGRGFAGESTWEYAKSSLDKVSHELFNRRITFEEAFYIGEISKGVGDVVAGKLMTSGLKRVAEILLRPTASQDVLIDCLRYAMEVLRAVLYIAGPSNDGFISIPGFESPLHEELIHAVRYKFECIKTMTNAFSNDCTVMTPALTTLARLLQLVLSFRGTWTTKAKSDGISLPILLFQLALRLSRGSDEEVAIYPLVIDTLYYLLDEIPLDTKFGFDPFRHYPDYAVADVPIDIPLDYRKQLLALLPHLPPNNSVADLVTTSWDQSGNQIHGAPVVNRPWEWVENLGELPIVEMKEEQREREEKDRMLGKRPFKNAGSLSLELFNAKITGDGLLPGTAEGEVLSAVRSFEDGLSVESIFRRDLRETRVHPDDGGALFSPSVRVTEDVVGDIEMAVSAFASGGSRTERRMIQKSSPASSVASRSSAWMSSGKQSPGYGRITDSASEAENNSTRSGMHSKRKLDAMSMSDDEIEIIEGPVAVVSGSGLKKTKSKVGKGKGKK